eukprot:TRINITY_DN29_c0_g1_i1.p1 TRINITY_DN29_c0_g1~~TRINITY_DN29_c0_g1_i1.p1  ORF type:complete len:813 (+),score=310.93 TRINITY_DN29_c0_g1_i1:156-2441(+)
MPFSVNLHLKALASDPDHLRARLLEEEADLKRQIAEVRKQLAIAEGGAAPAAKQANGTGNGDLQARVAELDGALAVSSFITSPAAWGPKDQAEYDTLKSNPQFRELLKAGGLTNVARWWAYGGQVVKAQAMAAKGVKPGAKQAQQGGTQGAQAAAAAAEEPAADKLVLQNAEQGKVVTRFPPEASGFMHIGHAKAGLTNWMLAQKYGGRMIFRFDDTNPAKEKHEYEEAIVQDTRRLGIGIDKVTYTSDRFDEMLSLCERMIKEGNAYCDDTPVDDMRAQRMARQESRCRNHSVEQNLAMWATMKDGTAPGTVVRAKIDMSHDNACLRDPVLYRVNNQLSHVRTGDKYKCYPTYDFACPIVDSLDGVTHALRTSEYNDRNAQYYWVLDALKMRKPLIEDFSRLNMEFTVMSKRKLTQFVDQGRVEGWDDPRMPTVKGLLRRGLTVDALRAFIQAGGMSKTNNFQEWGFLWNANSRVVDNTARRYTAVARDFSVKVKVAGHADGVVACQRPRHKKNPELGDKTYYRGGELLLEDVDCGLLKDGEEVTLMDWGNAFIRGYDPKQGTASAELHLDGDFKKTKYKLTWLADCPQNKVLCELVEYDHLITCKKPPKKERAGPAAADPEAGSDDDEDDVPPGAVDPLDAVMNPVTKAAQFAWAEEALGKEVNVGDIIQLERRGFFICDKKEPHFVLISIPDGHEKPNPLSMKARAKREQDASQPAAAAPKEKKGKEKKGGGAAPDQREMTLEERRAAKKAAKQSSGK